MRLLIVIVACVLIAGCGSSHQAGQQEAPDSTLDGMNEALAECRRAYPDEITQAIERAACVNRAIAPLRPLLRFPDLLDQEIALRKSLAAQVRSRTTNCRCLIGSCKSPNCIKRCVAEEQSRAIVAARTARLRSVTSGDGLCFGDAANTSRWGFAIVLPVRGYHIFMRALPRILAQRPKAEIVIVGGDGTSYGAAPPAGSSWKSIFLDEVSSQLDLRRVHFLGRVPYHSYIKVLQVSTGHVYLTYPFVLSWSVLEAMSAGCVVIGSDTPPVQEVIDGNNGNAGAVFRRRAMVRPGGGCVGPSRALQAHAREGASVRLRKL